MVKRETTPRINEITARIMQLLIIVPMNPPINNSSTLPGVKIIQSDSISKGII